MFIMDAETLRTNEAAIVRRDCLVHATACEQLSCFSHTLRATVLVASVQSRKDSASGAWNSSLPAASA